MKPDGRRASCVWHDERKGPACGAHATVGENLCEPHLLAARAKDPSVVSRLPRYPTALCACETCGRATPMLGTGRCDECWELEGRLASYLRHGGEKARAFVLGCIEAIPLGLLLLSMTACGGAAFAFPPGYESADASDGGEQVGQRYDGGEAGTGRNADGGGEAGTELGSTDGGEAGQGSPDAAVDSAKVCTTPLAITPHDLCPLETNAHAFPSTFIRSAAGGDCTTIAGFFNTPPACACAETYTCECLLANGVGPNCGTIQGIPWIY